MVDGVDVDGRRVRRVIDDINPVGDKRALESLQRQPCRCKRLTKTSVHLYLSLSLLNQPLDSPPPIPPSLHPPAPAQAPQNAPRGETNPTVSVLPPDTP